MIPFVLTGSEILFWIGQIRKKEKKTKRVNKLFFTTHLPLLLGERILTIIAHEGLKKEVEIEKFERSE